LAKQTQIWGGAGRATPPPSGWPKSALAECPQCHAPSGGRPFCLRDGAFTAPGPFSIGGRYQIEERLGAGGLALVFGARHQILGKQVAIKILRDAAAADPAHAERFLREARLASQLHHENIIDISDFGRDEALGVLYLVMERLRGETLAAALERARRLPWQRAVPILIQLCRALAAAHTDGVLHRDLNPRNVFLVRSSLQSDLVKLCDFGLSRLSSGEDRITTEGTFVGTPAYMAPEQIRGDADQDLRVDLYALGTTAYELLTGQLPYEAPNAVALVTRKLGQAPIPLGERAPELQLPAELEAILMRCLALDPAARPASAGEVEAALTQLTAAPETSAFSPEELVGRTVGSYHIVRLIGSGGAGAVYLAEHPLIAARVAVKVLRTEVLTMPGIEDRFIQEARAVAQLKSLHLPRYHDFGRLLSGHPFAVMEYLEGETVDARIAGRGTFTVEETAALLDQVAAALAEAHAAGIIHRDIKPENLFLVTGPDGQPFVKVLDFGIAKLTERPTNTRLTQTGHLLGTPSHASPEQLLGDEVGAVTDVYALGSTAFEMLCGRPPFQGEFAKLVHAKTTTEAPGLETLLPDVPVAVARTVARMLARDPAARPASMAEVRDALAAFRTPAAEVRPPGRRGAVVAALGLALAVALGLLLTRHRAAPAAAPAPMVVAAPTVPTVIAPPPVAPPPLPPPPAATQDNPPHPKAKRAAVRRKPRHGDIIIADPFEQ
jgi:serine/threonine protein kinase